MYYHRCWFNFQYVIKGSSGGLPQLFITQQNMVQIVDLIYSDMKYTVHVGIVRDGSRF